MDEVVLENAVEFLSVFENPGSVPRTHQTLIATAPGYRHHRRAAVEHRSHPAGITRFLPVHGEKDIEPTNRK
jgi:hypothetical protein